MDLVKIWVAPYQLKLRTMKNCSQRGVHLLRSQSVFCEGVLLKCEFCNGSVGHADLHPLPEKGEAPLRVHLEKLEKGEWTPLSLRARVIAQVEAQARIQNRFVLSQLIVPSSHYLFQDVNCLYKMNNILNEGFRVFKVKLTHPLAEQTEKLLDMMETVGKDVRWRVDFQESLSEKQWTEWKNKFGARINQENLDFIEAPFDYDERKWFPLGSLFSKEGKVNNQENALLRKKNRLPLALDVWGKQNTLPVLAVVWKCARRGQKELMKKWSTQLCQRVIFTHSLAHPLDQLASAFFASSFYHVHPSAQEVCGLIQKEVYESHLFSLPDRGPLFPTLSGVGWGFDDLLKNLPWRRLFPQK